MAVQKLTETNVKLCLERIKELLECLPEETFRADEELAKKKELADAAVEPLENFIRKLAEMQSREIDDLTCIEWLDDLSASACGRHAKINV
jgi:Glu-tRNA(Gln) amidotransferase subunit E-like FAD-binding protein